MVKFSLSSDHHLRGQKKSHLYKVGPYDSSEAAGNGENTSNGQENKD